MKITKELVIGTLSPDELDYKTASKLGRDSLPYLDELIQSASMLAPKAAYLVGLIKDEKSFSILLRAASSQNPSVRLSVALTAANLEINDEDSDRLLKLLEKDKDDIIRVGVNKSRLKRERTKDREEKRNKTGKNPDL